MRKLLILFGILFPAFLMGQFSDTPRKARLGFQTDANYLVYVNTGSPGHTPTDRNDTYVSLDTTNAILYIWDAGTSSWFSLYNGIYGGSGTVPAGIIHADVDYTGSAFFSIGEKDGTFALTDTLTRGFYLNPVTSTVGMNNYDAITKYVSYVNVGEGQLTFGAFDQNASANFSMAITPDSMTITGLTTASQSTVLGISANGRVYEMAASGLSDGDGIYGGSGSLVENTTISASGYYVEWDLPTYFNMTLAVFDSDFYVDTDDFRWNGYDGGTGDYKLGMSAATSTETFEMLINQAGGSGYGRIYSNQDYGVSTEYYTLIQQGLNSTDTSKINMFFITDDAEGETNPVFSLARGNTGGTLSSAYEYIRIPWTNNFQNISLFDGRYALPNATPSATLADTSFMVWIGSGAGTSPSFIEMASISSGGADNLGNHTATQDLDMANFDIDLGTGVLSNNGGTVGLSFAGTGNAVFNGDGQPSSGYGSNESILIQSGNPTLAFQDTGGSAAYEIQARASGELIFVPTTSATFGVGGSVTDFTMTMLSSGYVGLGAENPVNPFHIDPGSANSYVRFTNTSTGGTSGDGVIFGANTGGAGIFWNYEATATRFNNNGGGQMDFEISATDRLVLNSSVTTFYNNNVVLSGVDLVFGSGGPVATYGSGSPEGVKTADVGSIYLNTTGSAGTSAYIKESGTGNTGWAPILAHTASDNIDLGTHYLSPDGTNKGLYYSSGELIFTEGTANTTVKIDDRGLSISRTSDGVYQASITASANNDIEMRARSANEFFTNSTQRLAISETAATFQNLNSIDVSAIAIQSASNIEAEGNYNLTLLGSDGVSSRTTDVIIAVKDTIQKMRINDDGSIDMDDYGDNTFPGTSSTITTMAAFSTSGDVIELTPAYISRRRITALTVTIENTPQYNTIPCWTTGSVGTNFTVTGDSVITYTGSDTGIFSIDYDISFDGTANDILHFRIEKNDAAAGGNILADLDGAADEMSVSSGMLISLAQNDTIKIKVDNEVSADDIVVDFANIRIHRIH